MTIQTEKNSDHFQTGWLRGWLLAGILLCICLEGQSQQPVLLNETSDQVPARWPFERPSKVNPPQFSNRSGKEADWIRNDIDAFILSKLRERKWKPAPEASTRTLLRRLYFDLIGLPPTPGEIQTFLNDTSPLAYENLVDRLLKDPRYGERWARLWLDLARYADTAGYEGDPDLPHAWRYRDYVIDAFNNDKPYNLFIKEQIAGDEFAEILGAGDLPDAPPERTVAMTFLRLAPFTEPRGDESRHQLLSEMTSTVSSVFLGLTVGCAKCHDHKHDPIPTRDFYRMKAFFATVSMPRPERGDGFQIGGSIPAEFYRPKEKEWANQLKAKLENDLASSKTELGKLTGDLQKRLNHSAGFGLQAMGQNLGNDYIFGTTAVNDGKVHSEIINCDGKQWTFYTDGQLQTSTGSLAGSNQGKWIADLPSLQHISLGQYTEGGEKISNGDAHHVGSFGDILIYDHPLSEKEQTAIRRYTEAKYQPNRTNPSGRILPPQNGLQFWLDASDLDGNPETNNPVADTKVLAWVDKVSGVKMTQSQSRLAPKIASLGASAGVHFKNSFLSGPIHPNLKKRFANAESGSMVFIFNATHSHEGYGFELGGNGSFLSTFINPAAGQRIKLAEVIESVDEKVISRAEKERYRFLSTRSTFIPQHLKRIQPVAMSLRHSYGPPYEPGVPTSRVMIRGEYDNPGEVVEPGFLSCISGTQDPAPIRLDPFKRWPTRSRRMALANWIASEKNPLTARVIVNRLWHWHFGKGIVETPSDFGELSRGPSHPELLDWLANQFVKDGWSIKKMHRRMVTSNTYRQSSSHSNPAASVQDADNRLLWKFRSRRLEAEAIRDSILAVSGRLNPESYGLPIFPPLPGDIAERVKYSNSKWDTQHGPEGRKRSIYIYQQRTLTMPLMQAFDSLVCEQSRPRRRTSVTPLQALAMMNGRFLNDEAGHFARRIRDEVSKDQTIAKPSSEKLGGDVSQVSTRERQIQLAFECALARPPTRQEIQTLSRLASAGSTPEEGLISVCRVLLNSNEFVYVD